MGVGDIGAVQDGTWVSGDETYCVVRWRTIWQHERGMVGGRWLGQRDASGKRCGDGIGTSDGARVEPWACGFHGDGAVRADGMRGDSVGVGDICAVQGGDWGSEDETYCFVSWRTIWEHERGMVGGRWICQRDASGKQCRDGIGIIDSARVEPWACGFHGDGAIRADGMQGYGVGVGDIDAMPCGAWGSGNAACGDDGRGEARQHDGGILCRSWLYAWYA